jgi:hypothetical protein
MNYISFDVEFNADLESAHSIARAYLGGEKEPKKRAKIGQLGISSE